MYVLIKDRLNNTPIIFFLIAAVFIIGSLGILSEDIVLSYVSLAISVVLLILGTIQIYRIMSPKDYYFVLDKSGVLDLKDGRLYQSLNNAIFQGKLYECYDFINKSTIPEELLIVNYMHPVTYQYSKAALDNMTKGYQFNSKVEEYKIRKYYEVMVLTI